MYIIIIIIIYNILYTETYVICEIKEISDV